MNMERVIPAISWLKSYKSRYFYFDLVAGINLGVSMLPNAMAYALVAGLPPIYGLYASFVAPLIAIFFGSNKLLFTGPVGVMAVLVFTTLSPIAQAGSQEYINLAAMLSLIVGFIMLAIALLRLTFVLNLISHAAIIGFVNAAALIITATQLRYILGVQVQNEDSFIAALAEIFRHLPETNIYALSLSALSLASIALIRKYYPKLPATLILLAALTLAVYALNLEQKGIELVGRLPQGLPSPSLPAADIGRLGTLVASAAVIAIVGMAEVYSISKIVAYNTKQRVDFNQEFIGQGLANITTSLFMGYPVSGSFSGTTVNWSSGARSGVSIILFSLFALLSITLLTPLFYYLPKFMLACIVILAVMRLFKPRQFAEIYRINRYDGAVAATTFAVSLALKPDAGIIVGIVLALALYVRKSMQTSVYFITKDRKTGYFIACAELKGSGCEQLLILKPEGPFIYVNAEHMRDEILRLVAQHREARCIILDMGAVYYMDTSGIDAVRDLVEELQRKNVKLMMINLEEEVLNTIAKAELIAHIDIHETKKDAISSAFKYLDKNICTGCDRDMFVECKERRK